MAEDALNAWTAEYLLGTPLLSDYLEERMAELGLDRVEWSEVAL